MRLNLARGILAASLMMVVDPSEAAIAISARIEIQADSTQMRRGESAPIIFTLVNTGDEPLDLAYAFTIGYTHGPDSTVFIEEIAATAPCVISHDTILGPLPPPFPNLLFNQAHANPMPLLPGESRQCIASIRVASEASGPFIQRFDFYGRQGSAFASAAPILVHFNLGESLTGVPLLDPSRLIVLSLVLTVFAVCKLGRQGKGAAFPQS